MEASIYVSQSLLADGNGDSSLVNAFCFASLFRVGSVMPFDLEMATKRSDVRREPMRGSKRTAQMSLYRSYTAFLHLPVKLFLNESKNTDLIRWSDNGNSFIVLDEDEFAKILILELFKHNNYASFV
ncbi:hypothetical protein KXV52_000198, partial [Aspergillus fumigatus]